MSWDPYLEREELARHKLTDQPTLRLAEHLREVLARRPRLAPEVARATLQQALVGPAVREALDSLPTRLLVRGRQPVASEPELERWELELDIGDGLLVNRASLLRWRRAPRDHSLMLALHGHQHEGREWTCRDGPARDLIAAGFHCLAPDVLGLGETRGSEGHEARGARAYELLVMDLALLGCTLNGLRVWTLQRWLTEACAAAPLDLPTRAGVAGFSLGGELALFLAALDPTLSPVAVSHYCCPWEHSYWQKLHCRCAYVPGLMTELSMAELFAAVAPRPLALDVAREDRSFPWEPTRTLLADIGALYAQAGATERLQAQVWDGEHRFRTAPATREFLRRWGRAGP